MTYFILGVNSFIARNYYQYLRINKKDRIVTLSHEDLHLLKEVRSEDTVINFCGINRAELQEVYETGNHLFLKDVLNLLATTTDSLPYFIHVSSYMVNGFENTKESELPNYQRFFIESKRNGENFLKENYPNEKLCIVRPSNIYGYNCEPYYNNLLVTLVYEKITETHKITKINKNCERNFLSIDGLINAISTLCDSRGSGTYNIVSDQNLELDNVISMIYPKNIPDIISIVDDSVSIASRKPVDGELYIVNEDISQNLVKLENQMRTLVKVKDLVKIERRSRLSQPRGDMVEISSIHSKRLYMITLTDHSVRGNHYHIEQVEDFYIHRGKLMFLLAHKDDPTTIYSVVCKEGDCITVNPPIIHTLVNDFIGQIPEIFITSTFPYIKNVVLDTIYVNI